ncbi:MAG: hypothetical protein ACJAUD_001152 [Crocinitomicaceae bacterium]|jgi:hypothetical protein
MKNLLFITTLLIGLSGCNLADDADYTEIADEMCGCFNEATAGLSEQGRDVIIEAGKNDVDFQIALTEYAQNEPVKGMQDNLVLVNLGEQGFMDCMTDIQKKYDEVYTTDSEDEILQKVIKIMQKNKSCDLTYAIMKNGL